MWDVAIIGAGLAGLTCANQLTAAGYRVGIFDKARGLGGRMATRRVGGQTGEHLCIDHGLPYWQPALPSLQALTEELLTANILKPWAVSAYELRQRGVITPVQHQPLYISPAGMNAVGKYLARDFNPGENLFTSYRAVAISGQPGKWTIEFDDGEVTTAKQCAIAVPAIQAAEILDTYREDHKSEAISAAIAALKAVEYHPCLSVLAHYSPQYNQEMGELDPNGWMVTDTAGTSTNWVCLDSSKRDREKKDSTHPAPGPVIVIHSKPDFAQQYLNAGDLQPAASVLLRASARKFCPWIAQPEWFQIHRWLYAQIKVPYPEAALTVEDALVCGGDWCKPIDKPGITGIDSAYLSGLAIAERLKTAS